jgi:hypothetical protein
MPWHHSVRSSPARSAAAVLAVVLLAQATTAQGGEEWEEGRPAGEVGAQAEVPRSAAASVPCTWYATFSGTVFQPTSSSLTYSASGGAIYATALPPGGYSFSVEIELPQGATITEVVFYAVDNDGTDLGLSLRSYDPETDAFLVLASTTSSGASPTLQTVVMPVDPPVVIDNGTLSYRLRVAPGVASSAHLLRGARVGYLPPKKKVKCQ